MSPFYYSHELITYFWRLTSSVYFTTSLCDTVPGIRTGKRVLLSEQLLSSESRKLFHPWKAAQVRAGGLHVGNGTRARTCAGAGLLPHGTLYHYHMYFAFQ